MIIKNGKVFIDGVYHDIDVEVKDGLITRIGNDLKGQDIYDAQGKYVFAGFIDTHIHGACFVNCGESVESMRKICAHLPQYGVTSFVPTPTDRDDPAFCQNLVRNIRAAKGSPGADIAGIFIYSAYKNRSISYYAPPVAPTKERTLTLVDNDFSDIKALIIAPELPGGLEHISWLHENGVMGAIGFSEGMPNDITEAVKRGATITDHFPNGFPAIDHHKSMAVTQCLLEDDLYMQLNPDCIHVAPEFIKMMFRCKGEDKFVAVSDSSALMGLPEGEYQSNGKTVYIRDGAVRDASGKLVTGAHTYDENMRTFKAKGFSLETIGRIFTENAARAFHFEDRGKIEEGRRADLVIMNKDLYVEKTMIQGEWFYEKEQA